MSDKIKIDTLRDVLIIEKTDGNKLLKGSHIYCGCCGNSVGEMKNNLSSPFTANEFLKALKNKSIEWMILGLRHKTCRHSMFPFKKYFDFITLRDYNKQLVK